MGWRVLLLSVLSVLAIPGTAAPLRFAPLPLEDHRVVHEQFRGLADYLAAAAGAGLSWVAHDDYADILRGFRDGSLDLAYLGPVPYAVLARSHTQAEPLGCFREADGAAAYTCALVARTGARLRPGAVRGLRIGLPQPYSTCGPFAASEMLTAAGRSLRGDGNRFAFAGSHAQAALGVVRGDFDVASVKTDIARRYRHLDLDIIAESEPYPGFALVANGATLAAPVLARLRRAVRGLDPERQPELPAITAGWGEQIRHGVVPPARCDYSCVDAALERLPLTLPGLGLPP
ncbi:PhnD/SsuA/transferrin family substrate-binding protein [uncultured Thiohalocapsa sp.]|uniref:PhnD/SsuA/transferrin family substrate-binding protein n=1 Tax=uncultured Thiohalocapsa sp. TaxID=768990 RepID=UPI0025D8D4BC|nr:PhnD/SsuA/transferrin family substrate-binding protein [uncultured Thiohalocapsa sp.]